MSECIFCRILDGQLPASFVYHDRCAAFMDIQPVNPGHLLVVPVRHAASLADLDAKCGRRSHAHRTRRGGGALRQRRVV